MRLFAYALVFGGIVSVSTFGCSDPVVPLPAGAWAVTFTHSGASCNIQPHNAGVGTVATDGTPTLVNDGANGANVDCLVKPAGSVFTIDSSAQAGSSNLAITVKGMRKDATEDNPVDGTVQFISEKTANVFASTPDKPCKFFFVEGSKETIAAGAVWVSFTCDAVDFGIQECALSGIAKFQNCEGVPEQ